MELKMNQNRDHNGTKNDQKGTKRPKYTEVRAERLKNRPLFQRSFLKLISLS